MNIRYLIVILLLSPLVLFAQNKTIVVRDQRNNPLGGCTIFKQSVAIGITDSNGLFTINSNQNDLFSFRAIGYKSKSLLFENINTEVILFDSIVGLDTVQIRPTRLIKTTVGNGFKKRYNTTYRIHSGGFMGTKIVFARKSFFINELSFMVHDFTLPDQHRDMKIMICECPKDTKHDTIYTDPIVVPPDRKGVSYNIKHDTVGRKIYVDPIVVRLDRKGEWYTIKLDTINQNPINTNCIFVEFEMLYKPTFEKTRANGSEIAFGMTPSSKGITTFTHCTFSWYLNGFFPSWNAAHTPLKINVGLTEIEEAPAH